MDISVQTLRNRIFFLQFWFVVDVIKLTFSFLSQIMAPVIDFYVKWTSSFQFTPLILNIANRHVSRHKSDRSKTALVPVQT